MTELENNLLKKRAKSIVASKEEDDSNDEQEESEDQNLQLQAVKKTHPTRKGTEAKDGVQFKRKRAKVRNKFHVFLVPIRAVTFLALTFSVPYTILFIFSLRN